MIYVRTRKAFWDNVFGIVVIFLLFQVHLVAAQPAADGPYQNTALALRTHDMMLMARDETVTFVAAVFHSEVNASCGTYPDAPCSNLSVALDQLYRKNTSRIILLPGTHSSDGNCGLELGSFPVHIYSLPGTDVSETVLNCSAVQPVLGNGASTSENVYIDDEDCRDDLKSRVRGSGGFLIKPKKPGNHISINGITVANAVGATGGGLHISGKYANVSVTNVILRECQSIGSGGGIHVADGALVQLRNVTVNSCTGGFDGGSLQSARGGGIFIEGNSTRATLDNVSLTNNSLNSKSGIGGGIMMDDGASVRINDLVVSGNRALFGGGVTVGKECSVYIENAIIKENESEYGAGLGVMTGSAPTLNTTFISSNVAQYGGGMLIFSDGTPVLEHVTFHGNKAAMGGGAFAHSKSSFKGEACFFTSNRASISGGALNLQELSSVHLQKSHLESNTAPQGGGIEMLQGASAFIKSTVIKENNASLAIGGAVACIGGQLNISTASSIMGNTCATLGGGLYLTQGCFAELSKNVTLIANSAGRQHHGRCLKKGSAGGGAVAIEPSDDASRPTALLIEDCVITQNAAPDGGGIFVTNKYKHGAEVTLLAAFLSNNIATGCLDSFDVDVSESVAASCLSRHGSGGGISSTTGTLVLAHGSKVTRNEASADGGGLHNIESTSVSFRGETTHIADNCAGSAGGGVSHSGTGTLNIKYGVVISDNRARDGGGVAIVLPTIPLLGIRVQHGVVCRNNSAISRGAGFFLSSSMAQGEYSHVTLKGNDAKSGSDFFWERSRSLTIPFRCNQCESSNRYGSATEAIAISLKSVILQQFHSGFVAPSMQVFLLNQYLEVDETSIGASCRIGTNRTASSGIIADFDLSGELEIKSIFGIATFNRFIPRGRLGLEYQVIILCDGIGKLTFRLKVAHCRPGYEPIVSQKDAAGTSVARECSPCTDDTFNFDGVACTACPLGGKCDGGSSLDARAGWWRSGVFSEMLFACPMHSACMPGNKTASDACAEGYEGPVCGICSNGYRSYGGACIPCNRSTSLLFPSLGVLGFTAFLTYLFLQPAKHSNNNACLLSSLIFVVQSFGLLRDYDVTFPDGFDRLAQMMDLANFDLSALAPGCLSSGTNFYRSYLASLAVPPLIILLCYAFHYVVEYYLQGQLRKHVYNRSAMGVYKKETCEDIKRRCIRNATWLLVLTYSGVTKTIVQMFSVRHIDVGSFLRRDYSISTSDGTYAMLASTGYFVLLLYPIGIPVSLAWRLHQGFRDQVLDESDFRSIFGFLYGMYRPEFLAWELLVLFSKFFLACVPVFATERILRRHTDEHSNYRTQTTKQRGSSQVRRRLDYGVGSGFTTATQMSIAQAICLMLLVASLWFRPHFMNLHTAHQVTAIAIILGWTLLLGGVLNSEDVAESNTGENASDHSVLQEKNDVCAIASVATAMAVFCMLVTSVSKQQLGDLCTRSAHVSKVYMTRLYNFASLFAVQKESAAKRHRV